MSTDNFLVTEAQLVADRARKEKAERTKDLGEPITLVGQALAIEIQNSFAWIAENTTVVRMLDLETGQTLHLFKGHTGPVSCLAFCPRRPGHEDREILLTGSWDKSIKVWDTKTKTLISSTNAHSDFVKALFVFPTLGLLVSGGSDKIIRFWDISQPEQTGPLTSVGFNSSHTRPVECLGGEALSETSAVLFTGDTMGVINIWDLQKGSSSWTANLRSTISHHRTKINGLVYGSGQLWTASADETVRSVLVQSESPQKQSNLLSKALEHPVAVRAVLPLPITELEEPYLITAAGDVLRAYDISSLDEPELLGEVDAHWHDVVSVKLWKRTTVEEDGKKRVEPWVISTSLDKTIRKWKLSDLLSPAPAKLPNAAPTPETPSLLTEEEERELAELMG